MPPKNQSSIQDVLGHVEQAVKKEFDSNRSILSFDEYVSLFAEFPERQTRGSASYLADMMDHFGKTPLPQAGGPAGATSTGFRFHLFDLPTDGLAPKVVGQEGVQNHIYRVLRTFTRQGLNNKLILLHGPNGSAKSSIAHALMGGLERYSHTPEGAIYTFNWIFPVERYTKSGIGLNTYSAPKETLTVLRQASR